jgi:hypothetical protein
MGKTYKKQASKYDDEFASGRSGKHAKHANSKKTGGMRTLNSYVDDDFDEDPFIDDVGLQDEITIQHIQNDKP